MTAAARGLLPAAAAAGPPAYSVAYFTEGRPLLVNLHVTLDGKPLEVAWEEGVREMFRWLDRNGDGTLDRSEAARAPSAQQVRLMRQAGYTSGIGGAATFATLAELDTDEDGRVTPKELLQYYRSKEVRGLQLLPGPLAPSGGSPATRALLRLLDRDGDGRLSREELARAADTLAPLDDDEDELVSVEELLQGRSGPAALAAGAGMMAAPTRAPDSPPTLLLLPPIDVPNRLALWLEAVRAVIRHYDRDKNGTLDRREIDLAPALFAELDRNKDGELDELEVLKLLRRPADLGVVIRLGRLEGSQPPVALLGAPAAPAVPTRGDGRALVLALGDTELDLRRGDAAPASPSGQADQLRAAYVQRLKMADADGKGFVARADLKKPEFRNFLNLFDLADRDEDGRLTDEEFEAYFNAQARLVRDFATLTASEGGRDLFGLLDANRDGRLGPRELRSAWAALVRFDRGGKGSVSLDDVPRQVSLVLAPGTGAAPAPVTPAGWARNAPAAPTAAGPAWFRKMDRNGDGDASPREFLGPPTAFRLIDADGDGLISADEAARYDAAHRRP